jgi:DNA polymerase I
VGARRIDGVLFVVIPGADGAGRLRRLAGSGGTDGASEHAADLAARIGELECTHYPRWVWPSTAQVYPPLLQAGVRVRRCHDISAVEGVLLGSAGRHGEPRGLAAAFARTKGFAEIPTDRPPRLPSAQDTLFEPEPDELPGGADPLDAAVAVFTDQERRLADAQEPGRLRLLAAAESAGTLAAAEMGHFGLPWSAEVHTALLSELLGPRPSQGNRPRKLAALAERIVQAFGGRQVNPDQPANLVQAFAREGIQISSTRAGVLRGIDHPAVPPLLEYKELYRLWVAHGWSWLESWIHDGRFRPEYVVGGVVSGRWATRGGAALQLPRALRAAAVADPGHLLVVADAAQLEPRVLAALSGDRRLAEVAAAGDLYASLAHDSFDEDRPRAKIAMLSAMYGGIGGEAGQLLAVLRRRFPAAVDYVERAAMTGAGGATVYSRLGRASPPPSEGWRELTAATDVDGAAERRARQAARDWGRFTRNFVVQASASDWALAMLATLRLRLLDQVPEAELVFFVHDEVIVHCKEAATDDVREHLNAAAAEAGALVFGDSGVRFPLEVHTVRCYADAK